MEHLKTVALGKALTLSTNNRIAWKVLPGTNGLAYYENPQITDKKSFMTLPQDENNSASMCHCLDMASHFNVK